MTFGDWADVDLSEFDVVWLRQDPPFDMGYITNTHLLDRVHPGTFVVNDPFWVRNSPEKLLDYLLHYAVRERTTDIHLAPSDDSLHVLFRVDGVLRPMFAMPSSLNRLLGYIKLAAEMDISERAADYSESALERVLRHLSFCAHREQVRGRGG